MRALPTSYCSFVYVRGKNLFSNDNIETTALRTSLYSYFAKIFLSILKCIVNERRCNIAKYIINFTSIPFI